MLSAAPPTPYSGTRLSRAWSSGSLGYDPVAAARAQVECGLAPEPQEMWRTQFAHLHRHHLRLEDRIEDVRKRSDAHAGVVWAVIALVLGMQLFSLAALL